jgi:hypothetical protein
VTKSIEVSAWGAVLGLILREVWYAGYDSRDGLRPFGSSFDGNTAWQNLLVGRGEVGTLSKAGKTIGAMRRLESGRYSQSDQKAFGATSLPSFGYRMPFILTQNRRLSVKGTRESLILRFLPR